MEMYIWLECPKKAIPPIKFPKKEIEFQKFQKKLIKNIKISFLGFFDGKIPKKEIFPIKKWWMCAKIRKKSEKNLKIIKKFPRVILSMENAKNRKLNGN
jgi:hypothetical protein